MSNFIVTGGLGGSLVITEGWGAPGVVPAGQSLISFETGSLRINVEWEGDTPYLTFGDGINDIRQQLPFTVGQAAGADWAIIKLVRSGTSLIITVDKTVVATITGITNITYGGLVTILDQHDAKIFDPRVKAGAISKPASDYYYDDVYDNAGKALLPNR